MRIIPNRDYRLLVAGGVVSQLGDWAARLALALLVFQRTGSATAVGLTAALLVLPWLGPGQWLASRGDRLDRRRLLVACDLLRGVAFLVIGLASLPVPVILALVVIAATVDPVFEANRSALVAEVVPRDDYPAAVQFDRALDQSAQLVGYGAGGFLVAMVGPGLALAVNGLTFLLSAAVLSAMRYRSVVRADADAPRLRAAWTFLTTDRLSAVAVAVTVVVVFSAMSVAAQAPVYGQVVAGLTEAGVGLLAAAVPAATIGVLAVVRTTGQDLDLVRRGLIIGTVAGPASALVLGGAAGAGAAFVGFALVGVLLVLSTLANMAVGRRIPEESRVSVFAVLQALVFVAGSAGMVAGGALSDLFTPRWAAALVLGLSGVVAVGGLFELRRVGRNAQADAANVPA